MFRKNYFTFLLAIAIFFIGNTIIVAQSSPVRGKVQLKKADGTTVPLADAKIDVYRMDIKGSLPSGKTDKKGEFSIVGFLPGGVYALSVSAPGARADVFLDIKGGDENLSLTLNEGDGKALAEADIRQMIANLPKDGKKTEMTAEEKKAEEERLKRNAEITEKNKNIESINAVIKRASTDGVKYFKEKNYDAAITAFEEGYNADPEFVGTAAFFLKNKGDALVLRATDKSNETKNDKDARTQAMPTIKKGYEDAIVTLNKSIELINTSTETDAKVKKALADLKMSALERRKEAYRLMARTGADRTKGKEAQVAYQEYIDALSDEKSKAGAQLSLAETLQESNEFDLAITEFEKVLAVDPNNVDALAGISLNLVNVGFTTSATDAAKGKMQLQQAANYLQKFLEVAPDTHPYKDDAKALIETLKNEQKIAPQKNTKKKN